MGEFNPEAVEELSLDELLDFLEANPDYEGEADDEEIQRGGGLVTRNGVAYQQLKDIYGKTVGWLNTATNEVVPTLPVGGAGAGPQMQAGGAASVTRERAIANIEASGGTVTTKGDIIIGSFEDGSQVMYDPSDAGTRGILYNPTYVPPKTPSNAAPTIREVYDPATGTMRLKGYNPETKLLDIDFGQASPPPAQQRSNLQAITIAGRVVAWDPMSGSIVSDLGPAGTGNRPPLSKNWLTAREGDFNLTPDDLEEQLELAALAGFKVKGKTVYNEDTGEAWRFESQKMPTEGQGGLQDRFRLRQTAGPAEVFKSAKEAPAFAPSAAFGAASAPQRPTAPSPAPPAQPGMNSATGQGVSAPPPSFVTSAFQQNPEWAQFASLNAQGMPVVDQAAFAKLNPPIHAAGGAELMLDEPTFATFTGMRTGRQQNVFAAEQPGMRESVAFMPTRPQQPPVVDYRRYLQKAMWDEGFATKKQSGRYRGTGGNKPIETLLSERGRRALAVLTG